MSSEKSDLISSQSLLRLLESLLGPSETDRKTSSSRRSSVGVEMSCPEMGSKLSLNIDEAYYTELTRLLSS